MASNDVSAAILGHFCRKYLWWEPVGGEPFSQDRVIAQVMNFATYDDILLLEQAVDKLRLADIMRRAEPGWFSDRSWEFWRGRLSFATGEPIPQEPPRREFHAATT